MESEITNVAMQPEAPDLPLSEPHFDDEATVLSARPVVPLAELGSSRPRFARGWVLAVMVVAAMFLGALASLLYLSRFESATASSIFDSETLAGGAVGEATESPSDQAGVSQASGKAASDDQESVGSEPAQESPATTTENEGRKPAARRVDVLTYPSTREQRKAARRLAKEQRREWERQNRRPRDLTRIREIFEGPERP